MWLSVSRSRGKFNERTHRVRLLSYLKHTIIVENIDIVQKTFAVTPGDVTRWNIQLLTTYRAKCEI